MQKNKLHKIILLAIISLPVFWFFFVSNHEFRLIDPKAENDISIKISSTGKAVDASITNNSIYTITSMKIACESVIHTGDCSLRGIIISEFENNRCKIISNDIHESLIKSPIIPGATHNKYFEMKESWRQDSLNCRINDPRGYESLWPERIIGRILF